MLEDREGWSAQEAAGQTFPAGRRALVGEREGGEGWALGSGYWAAEDGLPNVHPILVCPTEFQGTYSIPWQLSIGLSLPELVKEMCRGYHRLNRIWEGSFSLSSQTGLKIYI